MFPANFDRYIEVFGGGGWVLFGKPPDDRCMEVYNDYNSNLANLFYCVKNRTGAFLKELGFLPLNSRDEFTVIRKFIEKQEPDTRFLIEELELAEKPMYRLVDGKGRVLIPKSMREAAKLEYGDIVCLGMAGGKITVRKVEVIEVGDQSPEAVEAYVRTAFQFMPDSLRLDLIGELSRLLQKKEG